MLPITDAFEFDYFGSQIVYGRGRVSGLGDLLAEAGFERALVVTGSNSGANRDLMGPIEAALGNRLAGVFERSRSGKHIVDAAAGVAAYREVDADVIVAVGGGASVDVSRMTSALHADGRAVDDIYAEIESRGSVSDLELHGDTLPFVAVPATFAGAGISRGGSLVVSAVDENPGDDLVRVGAMDPALTPVAMVYDPDLFETTPPGVLARSAMNGFDKAVEMTYIRNPTPITDATAVHAVRLLSEALPRLGTDPDAMDRSVIGIVTAQFERRISILHAFGHGLARRYPVQQGQAHGVMAPHVIRYVYDTAEARRSLLATGFGVNPARLSDDEMAAEICGAVESIRDALGLESRLRDLSGVDRDDFPAIADFVLDDHALAQSPAGVEPTRDDVLEILRAAW